MSGALLTTLGGANTGGGGGGVIVPGPLVWTDIYGQFDGQTNLQTLSLITVPILIAATNSGTGVLGYLLNGVFKTYTGAFGVAAGDTLAWSVAGDGIHNKSGTITVKNMSDGAATLDSFSYLVTA